VETVYAITADIDDGDVLPMSAMVSKLNQLSLYYVVHSTTKSTQDQNRYRVILPLDEPFPADEFPSLFASFRLSLDGLPDRACSDASRLNIVPRFWVGSPDDSILIWDDAEAHHDFQAEVNGLPLDARRLMTDFPVTPEIEKAVEVRPLTPTERQSIEIERDRLVSPAIVKSYMEAPSRGGRLFRFMSAVAVRAIYADQPISAAVLADLALEMNAKGPSPSRRTGLHREAQRAIDNAARYVGANPPKPATSARLSVADALRIKRTRHARK